MTDPSPVATATPMTDYAPETPAPNGTRDRLPSLQARPLSEVLDSLRETVSDPGAAGGVPVPDAWGCLQATLGGIYPRDLYAANDKDDPENARNRGGPPDSYRTARARGTHLPAGLHVFTGQTGGGKTAVAMNLVNAALDAGHPVLYVSLELDESEVAARLVGLRAGLLWSDIARRRPLSPVDTTARDAELSALAPLAARVRVLAPVLSVPVHLVQAEALDLWRVWRKVPLVVFDYLQLAQMRVENAERLALREHLGAVTLELRALSRHIREEPDWPGCPVVVLSSTARANVKRSGGRDGDAAVPGMDGRDPDALRKADLETLKALPKEAGEIESTAVTAWVIALGERPAAHGPRPLTLRLAKNRYGMPGHWIPYAFDGRTGQLTEDTARYQAAREEDALPARESDARRKRPRASASPFAGDPHA